MKGEGAVDHSRVSRGFKKFFFGFKNLGDQVKLGKDSLRVMVVRDRWQKRETQGNPGC